MRQTQTSPFTGITSIKLTSLAELEYEKLVEEIDNEKFEKEQIRQIEQTYPPSVLNSLSGTENFTEGAIKHIFNGEINSRGMAVGYHYEGIEPTEGHAISETKSIPDRNGVYEANVSVNGVAKRVKSTFFPREWTPQQVVNVINEAYEHKISIGGNKYIGVFNGLSIEMYISPQGKIKSAHPIKERL